VERVVFPTASDLVAKETFSKRQVLASVLTRNLFGSIAVAGLDRMQQRAIICEHLDGLSRDIKHRGLKLPRSVPQSPQKLPHPFVARCAANDILIFSRKTAHRLDIATAADCFHVIDQFM
jgi:hypothetical protein